MLCCYTIDFYWSYFELNENQILNVLTNKKKLIINKENQY